MSRFLKQNIWNSAFQYHYHETTTTTPTNDDDDSYDDDHHLFWFLFCPQQAFGYSVSISQFETQERGEREKKNSVQGGVAAVREKFIRALVF